MKTFLRRTLWVTCLTAMNHSFMPAAITLAQDETRRVKIDETEAKENLAKFAATWTTLKEWNARKATIHEGILSGLELVPLPKRTPLNPIIHSKREHDGYSVENVAIEAWPGFFVTGNLYRPLGTEAPQSGFPGVLCVHGHFQRTDAEPEGRFRSDMQKRCATLARMGAVVFAYDMNGWGESNQAEHHHPDSVTIQTWSSMRAVDFLQSLPEVNAARMAITGASGGGTQSFLLAALDERITCSVPVVMVSAHFFGGCECESGKPIHRREGAYETNNAEIAAMGAPCAQLIISCGEDWTKNTPDVEFPYIQRVYAVYDALERVANMHFADEGHDYGHSKRLPMYRFLAIHHGLSMNRVMDIDGWIDESWVVIHSRDELRVFSDEHPRPSRALEGREAVMTGLHALQQSNALDAH